MTKLTNRYILKKESLFIEKYFLIWDIFMKNLLLLLIMIVTSTWASQQPPQTPLGYSRREFSQQSSPCPLSANIRNRIILPPLSTLLQSNISLQEDDFNALELPPIQISFYDNQLPEDSDEAQQETVDADSTSLQQNTKHPTNQLQQTDALPPYDPHIRDELVKQISICLKELQPASTLPNHSFNELHNGQLSAPLLQQQDTGLQPFKDEMCDKILKQIHFCLQCKTYNQNEFVQYKCPDPYCPYKVKNTKDRYTLLRDHINRYHSTSRQLHKCPYCTASNHRLETLKSHINSHPTRNTLNPLSNTDKEQKRLNTSSLQEPAKKRLKQRLILKMYTTDLQCSPPISRSIQDIIEQHRTPGFQEENQVIFKKKYKANKHITIESNPHKTGPSPSCNVTITFMPSLQQARNQRMLTGYCGYYAIFNANQFFNNQGIEPSEQHRKSFLDMFDVLLNSVQEYRKNNPKEQSADKINLQNLESGEIEVLIKTPGINAIFAPLQDLFCRQNSLGQSGQDLSESHSELSRFAQAKNFSSINLIVGVNERDGRWFALRADKDYIGNLHIYVADSAHTPAWYQQNRHQIIKRIMPYAYLFLGMFNEAKQLFME